MTDRDGSSVVITQNSWSEYFWDELRNLEEQGVQIGTIMITRRDTEEYVGTTCQTPESKSRVISISTRLSLSKWELVYHSSVRGRAYA